MTAQAQRQAERPYTPQDARATRRSYQQIAHVVNRLLNRIVEGLDEGQARAFKPSVFATVHSLHGLFNGREVSEAKPFFKSHQYAARHFNYKGKPENAGDFMGSRLDGLRAAELACGLSLVRVRRADGLTQELTSYEGHPLLDAAEWVYFQARQSAEFWKNPAAAISDELLDAGIARLPEVEPLHSDAKLTTRKERAEMGAGDLMADAVVKGMRTKALNSLFSYLEKEAAAGRSPLQAFANLKDEGEKFAQRAEAKFRQDLARKRHELLRQADEPEAEEERYAPAVGGSNSARSFSPGEADEEVVVEGATPPEISGGSGPQTVEECEVAGVENQESEISMPAAAAYWARRGWPVFPLHTVTGGLCSCAQGAECRSAGKHPRTPNGVKDATTDAGQIAAWWRKWPAANVGGAMGGARRLLAVDLDPRNGGNASLFDLCEAHGHGWLETRQHKTGSGGYHFLFTVPEGVEFHRGKLAPGIDVKFEGGYVVLPPSLHASGLRYSIDNKAEPAEAPAWLLDELTRSPEQLPAQVINFQERRDQMAGGGVIVEGERNERLFKVGCAMWGKGEVGSRSELYSRLLEVNAERVSPPLAPSEVVKIVQSISSRYPLGVPIQGATA